jgi:hypothetical protein
VDLAPALPLESQEVHSAPPPRVEGLLNPRRVKASEVDLQVDADFEAVLPRPGAAQRVALHASLLAHGGTHHYLLLWAGTSILIDGIERYRFCRTHDLWLWIGEIVLPDRRAVIEYIRREQLGARNLDRLAASVIRGEHYLGRKVGHGGDRKSERAKSSGNNCRLIDTARQVSAELGVSERTLRSDARWAQMVADVAANCGPQARLALLCPDHRVTRRGLEYLHGRDAEAQQAAIQYLLRNRKLPSREEEERTHISLPRREDKLVAALIRRLGLRAAERFRNAFAAALELAKVGRLDGADEGRARRRSA